MEYITLVDSKFKKLAEGVKFSDGKTCVQWLGDNKSIVVWDNIDSFKAVSCSKESGRHCFTHKTKDVVFIEIDDNIIISGNNLVSVGELPQIILD